MDLVGTIESNVLTAPGPPGSVDKGERQERGYMLKLSTRKPVTSAIFVLSMKVIPDTSDKSGGSFE